MSEPARRGRNLRAYRRKAARLRRANTVCWLCGLLIDVNLPATHPKSWTADHVDPLAVGGHVLGEMRACHRDCNSARGTKPAVEVQPPRRSREW